MSIKSLLKHVCVQTAVHWKNPVSDGRGGSTFDIPVEIKCRWDEKTTLLKKDNNTNQQIVSGALITIPLDTIINEKDYLYLGTLIELGSSPIESSEIKKNEGAYEVLQVDKTPLFKSATEFVRTVYL